LSCAPSDLQDAVRSSGVAGTDRHAGVRCGPA
jgi:hypothetical protein